ALLREALVKTGKVGLAKVVIATKQHLAVLVPSGPALVLNLLRWGDEVKSLADLDLPAEGVKGAKVTPAEMKMAEQLINQMSGRWKPEDFKDEFKHAVMKIVQKKVKAGDTETVIEPEEEAPEQNANVIDLTELLQRSLKGSKGSAARKRAEEEAKPPAAAKKPVKAAAKKPVRKATPAKRRA
ncbi:Ku protein, partial [Variovorax rhizosphaerae]